MTTICFKDGVLAGDTLVSTEEGLILTDNFRKVFKLRDGALFGAAGDLEAGEIMLRSVSKKGWKITDLPEGSEVHAVLVTPQGEIYRTEGKTWIKWLDKIIAIGSGAEAAWAALRLGHSAIEAVRVAMTTDTATGGRVQHVRLK